MKNIGAESVQLDKLTSKISDKGYNEKYIDDVDASNEVKSFKLISNCIWSCS